MVGHKRGSWYQNEVSTVTQEEFRYARNKFEQTGDISLLTFIRDDVWAIINEYNRSQGTNKSEIMEDIKFTRGFIEEITRNEDFITAQKQGQRYPKGTWVSRFSRFSDIIDVMSMTMNIETNRRMEILRTLALEELQETIRLVLMITPALVMRIRIHISHYLKGFQMPKIQGVKRFLQKRFESSL